MEIDEEGIEELILAVRRGRLGIGPGPWQTTEMWWRVPIPVE